MSKQGQRWQRLSHVRQLDTAIQLTPYAYGILWVYVVSNVAVSGPYGHGGGVLPTLDMEGCRYYG